MIRPVTAALACLALLAGCAQQTPPADPPAPDRPAVADAAPKGEAEAPPPDQPLEPTNDADGAEASPAAPEPKAEAQAVPKVAELPAPAKPVVPTPAPAAGLSLQSGPARGAMPRPGAGAPPGYPGPGVNFAGGQGGFGGGGYGGMPLGSTSATPFARSGSAPTGGGQGMLERSRKFKARLDNAPAAGDKPALPAAPPVGDPLASAAEKYDHFADNPFVAATDKPLSTFSADVNTASYSNVRNFIYGMSKPPADAVRIAELVNYFDYAYPRPEGADPVAFGLEVGPCPWKPSNRLVKIALAARKFESSDMPARNLLFLVDTSGSMQGPQRIGLVQQSLKLLTDSLRPNDRVGIVTYAGDSRVALEPTGDKAAIIAAIDSLTSGGSTNGAGGIEAAYALATRATIPGGVNRVVLLTDGDFNVGVTSPQDLDRLIESKRQTGVFLTVCGYGRGNLADATMERLARHGNGHYAYIDTLDEARKVFGEQGGALVAVAKDVKFQAEFNPRRVARYRLVGFENRLMADKDFRDDAKDAGDLGSGHTVTVLYEVEPATSSDAGDWLTVRMRYKQPDAAAAVELAKVLKAGAETLPPSADLRFASAVAMFGMILRDSPDKGAASWDLVKTEADAGTPVDPTGRRAEFRRLADAAAKLAK